MKMTPPLIAPPLRPLVCGLAILALAATSGCGGRASGLANESGELVKKSDAQPLVDAAEAAWAEREDRAKADEAIAKWEEAAEQDPTRADVPLKLAYAYYFLANAHVRWEKGAKEKNRALFDKGVKSAERAIKLTSPEFAEKIRGGAKWRDAVKSVGKEGIGSLYWYATNLSKWAEADGFTSILAHKDDVYATIAQVREHDETFFYGAPHRYLGAYHTKIPFPGGDQALSKGHFEKAQGFGPNYLENRLLFAEYYCVKFQDEDLYRKLLEEILAAPDDLAPELIAENKNAKRRAKQMLDTMDDVF